MALAMSRPWKHPTTGIYWLRKAVPADLREALGKREEKFSLKTRDQLEAKIRLSRALADIESRWASLRKGPTAISERQASEHENDFYQMFVARHLENPSRHGWNTHVGALLDMPEALQRESGHVRLNMQIPLGVTALEERERLIEICRTEVNTYLARNGIMIDEGSHTNLVRVAGRAFQRASLTLNEYANHGYPRDEEPPRRPEVPSVRGNFGKPVTFDQIWADWSKEVKPAQKTLYTWERVFRQFAAFVDREDATLTTPDEIIRWKQSLVDQGLASKTIRDGKLAPLKAIFQWAADNRRLAQNPAVRVQIDLRKKPSERKRSFSDAEAKQILKASLTETLASRRWLPWLCAFTGARISEISQLRKQDVAKFEGVWCLHLAPEAGSLKNSNSERVVPLHSALLAIGLLDFVATASDGPLFLDIPPDRFGNRGGNATKVIGKWIRALGLTDARLSPSHSWRHRFQTMHRRYGLALDHVDAITGHARRNVGDSYGEFPISALKREIEKLPGLEWLSK